MDKRANLWLKEATMKTKCLTVFCLLAFLASQSSSFAEKRDPAAIAVDTILVRPVCLVSTIVGSALFAVSLPIAAMSKSVGPAKEALITKPARATFTRPLGDLDALTD